MKQTTIRSHDRRKDIPDTQMAMHLAKSDRLQGVVLTEEGTPFTQIAMYPPK